MCSAGMESIGGEGGAGVAGSANAAGAHKLYEEGFCSSMIVLSSAECVGQMLVNKLQRYCNLCCFLPLCNSEKRE
jgi:hypothetical protein